MASKEKIMKLILGSQSPRRKEILQFFSYPFEQIPSQFDESSISFQGEPCSYALTLSQKKAESLLTQYPNDLILTADTVVFCENKIYNKPKHREEAISFLQELSSKWHSVYTGVTLAKKDKSYSALKETKILFDTLSLEQIKNYLNHINFSDKAGAYAIQQGGSIIIKQIEGCYYNVMGLPIDALKQLFSCMGIDLWNHLKIL